VRPVLVAGFRPWRAGGRRSTRDRLIGGRPAGRGGPRALARRRRRQREVREGARGGSAAATGEALPTTARLRVRGGRAIVCEPARGGQPAPRVTFARPGCECVIKSWVHWAKFQSLFYYWVTYYLLMSATLGRLGSRVSSSLLLIGSS
jgi:hypothetical protein